MTRARRILEQAQAMVGDWEGAINLLGNYSADLFRKKWQLVDSIPDVGDVYKLRNSLRYVIGVFRTITVQTKQGPSEKEVFTPSFGIALTRMKTIERYFGKHIVSVDGVGSSVVGKGIATAFYKWLVVQGYTVLGDKKQFFGARKLWSRLSKEVSVRVDIIDLKTKKVLFSNVNLKQGQQDSEFDNRVWTRGTDMKNVRTLLTGVT